MNIEYLHVYYGVFISELSYFHSNYLLVLLDKEGEIHNQKIRYLEMQKTISIEGKQLQITFSHSAVGQLSSMKKPILVEMELYFSCLIRKRTRFLDEVTGEAIPVLEDKLYVRFRPVMTDTCNMDSVDETPPLTDFPIHNVQHYVPKWLRLDYRRGSWRGEFGYGMSR